MDNQGQQATPDQNNGSAQAPTPATTGSQTAPYEVPLTKAFDKLTSEVFLFLLASETFLKKLAAQAQLRMSSNTTPRASTKVLVVNASEVN